MKGICFSISLEVLIGLYGYHHLFSRFVSCGFVEIHSKDGTHKFSEGVQYGRGINDAVAISNKNKRINDLVRVGYQGKNHKKGEI